MMTMPLVQTSKAEPSLTALRMPSGMEIEVGQERDPQAERDRHRHLLEDQVDHRDVAEIALAEIEADIVPQHQAEALERRLVEAELLFELGDEFGVEPLCAAVFGRAFAAFAEARRRRAVAAAAADAVAGVAALAGQLGDDLLDRAARRELDRRRRKSP